MDEHDRWGPGRLKGGTDPRPGPTRRITLADLQIMVAAAGVALMVLMLHLREGGLLPTQIGPRGLTALAIFWPWVIRLMPFLVVASPALLLMRLRRPRPSRRRVFRQPGTAACLAATFSGSLSVLATLMIVRHSSIRIGNPITYCLSGLERLGGSVLLVWLTLALAGAWRPAPDWIDYSGRALGVVLIVVYILAISRFLVP